MLGSGATTTTNNAYNNNHHHLQMYLSFAAVPTHPRRHIYMEIYYFSKKSSQVYYSCLFF